MFKVTRGNMLNAEESYDSVCNVSFVEIAAMVTTLGLGCTVGLAGFGEVADPRFELVGIDFATLDQLSCHLPNAFEYGSISFRHFVTFHGYRLLCMVCRTKEEVALRFASRVFGRRDVMHSK